MEFRYRYVKFGTRFHDAKGSRPANAQPSALHANEIAVDVGGVCWGYDTVDYPVIDHHFQRPDQYPSASAAVLHLAHDISARFSQTGHETIWLVTHRQPDFDAFCSMYLVRQILERTIALPAGDGGIVPPGSDWFNPGIDKVPDAYRWPILLAAYASYVDNGRRMACPRQRCLHSVLYAAIERGRPYKSETSGALEYFDEVKQAVQDHQFNPLFDSVLEDSDLYKPELAVLDREAVLYQRDVHRALKATVSLQRLDGEFRPFYERVQAEVLLGPDLKPRECHTASATEERQQADAIYLKDPRCLLFKEWARTDLDNSAMGAGFTFTAVAYSGERAGNPINSTNYYFSLDPEMAAGRHLYGLWARLQAAEIAALEGDRRARKDIDPEGATNRPDWLMKLRTGLERAAREAQAAGQSTCRVGYEGRADAHQALFDDPWFDGDNYDCTIVATPDRGTVIGKPGILADLSDDEVVKIVRRELENSIYTSPLTWFDLPANGQGPALASCEPGQRCADLEAGAYRFACVDLNSGVNLFAGHIARQVGETLWGALHPDLERHVPEDFLTKHLLIGSEWLGVWSRHGIAVAVKPDQKAGRQRAKLEERFRELVSLVGRVERYIATEAVPGPIAEADDGQELTYRAARLAYELTLPESRLLSRFYEELGLRQFLESLRDLNQAAATGTVAEVQTKLEKLEMVICAIYGGELMHLFVLDKHGPFDVFIYVGAGVIAGWLVGWLFLKSDGRASSSRRVRRRTRQK